MKKDIGGKDYLHPNPDYFISSPNLKNRLKLIYFSITEHLVIKGIDILQQSP